MCSTENFSPPFSAEALKNYSQQTEATVQAQKMRMEQLLAGQGLHSMDQSNMNKTIAMQPGTRGYNPINNRIGTTFLKNYGVTGATMLNPCQNLPRSSRSTDQNYYNPNLAHPSISANKSVNSLSCTEQNNQQCSAVDDEKKVIQRLLQELHNNKEAIEQQTGRRVSNVVPPREAFNGGDGGNGGLPV